MAELWFYHLERARLETVLPELLEKTLQRGWRALVHAGAPERAEALSSHLWTYRDEAFLPHGTADEPNAAHQPVLLTTGDANLNKADVLILTEAEGEPLPGARLRAYARTILIFNGQDEEAVKAARVQWTAAKGEGIEVSYWQQSPEGRWAKKA